MRFGWWMRAGCVVVLGLFVLPVAPHPAAAQCSQPTGETVPTGPGCDGGDPTGLLATFACVCDEPGVCNIGEVCDPGLAGDDCPDLGMNATCESRMWHKPNDDPCIPTHGAGLDPVADCSLRPETFAPTCPLTFTVVTRGTARFRNVFGWYEVGEAAPTPDDLHVMLGCDDEAGTSVVLDVRSDPTYGGGEIGFFLLTPEDHASSGECAGGDCCASVDRYRSGVGHVYYSQRTLNPEDDPFVHLLVYDSVVWSRKFYFAWEDTFAAPNNDFTDLVTSVEGIECSGGGAACDTGMEGACAEGVTSCEGGTVSCHGIYEPEAERCNGMDDDCDGEIDEGAECGAGEVCDDGRCVPDCELGEEFACPLEFECNNDTGRCIEAACRDVHCEEGSVCRGGECFSECEGVVCPHGQTCRLDSCVSPCDGVTCAAGQVCRGGICLPGCNQCNGVTCTDGTTCDETTGRCHDPSCPDGCPGGTFCREGSCVDDCEGAACPRGQVCTDGRCTFPGEPGTDAGGGGGALDGGTSAAGPTHERNGCGCRVPAGPSRVPWVPASSLAIAVIARLRRRRSRVRCGRTHRH